MLDQVYIFSFPTTISYKISLNYLLVGSSFTILAPLLAAFAKTLDARTRHFKLRLRGHLTSQT